jgi:hypothetical protein
VPSSASAAERLAHAESALLGAKNLTASFELDSKGENAAHLTGTIDLVDGNAMHLVAEGHFKSELVQVELDSRDSSGIVRTTTKGPSVSSHRDPPAAKVREVMALGIARMGLLHNLVVLTMDQPLEKTEGGYDEWVKALEAKDGAAETFNGESCRRVDYVLQVEGKRMAEASLCISDTTGLPLQRTQTVHFETGEMTETETFKWQMK